MASRSIFLGQAQSKSARGLKRPRWLRVRRRSRLRRPRSRASVSAICSSSSMGLQRLVVAWATRSSSPAAATRKPRRRNRSARAVMVDLLGPSESVVGGERMRHDLEVPHARVVG